MPLLLWLGLWGLIQLSGSDQVSSVSTNCSETKEDFLLPSANRTICGRGQHLRSGGLNMTVLNATHLPTEYLQVLENIPCPCEHTKSFLTCLLQDRMIARFIIFIFMLWLFGNRTIFFFLLFRIRKTFFTVYIWNLAVADFGALLVLCSIFIFFCTCEDSSDALVKLFLLLAYLFFFMQGTSMHFLISISIDWFLAGLFPIWHRRHSPKYLSVLLSAIVSALLWALSCWLLLFFNLGLDPQSIIIITLMIFAPLMVISTQTLVIKIWRNLGEQGEPCTEILLGMFFSLVTWAPLNLFFALHRDFATISSLAFVFTSLSGTINPVLYILIGQTLLSDSGSLMLYSRWVPRRGGEIH
ncbi:mas-related G-protein coupled receptor member H-like [Podarcis lilfordi]|uniref:Mas-related G-protein coupled receptor member H-like n=1 Tax=Podarcis lilfordi TaxID=74358 RepID=A0AA35KL38_9SAUR|nr:mas-related G-protein coupled receptor member H-like [Podarcis lilfordi]